MLFFTVLAFNLIGDRVAQPLRHPGGGAVSDGVESSAPERGPLLEVTDLRTPFRTDRGLVRAVDGVTFTLERGRTLGIVGESGSGKTVLSRSIMGLLPDRKASCARARSRFDGPGASAARRPSRCATVWGREMAMIFQDPMTSLNPVMKIGKQITESLSAHLDMPDSEAEEHRRAAAARRRHPRARAPPATSTRTSCRAACASG